MCHLFIDSEDSVRSEVSSSIPSEITYANENAFEWNLW